MRLIFGCGYVGHPVGKKWLEEGDKVFVVTRSKERAAELEAEGFDPIVADITQPDTLRNLPEVDTVLVAVGMDRSRYDDIYEVYVGGLNAIIDALPDATGHLIYISSTGVFGDFGGEWVDEDSPTEPTRDGGKACLAAENSLKSSKFESRCTVLRLSGIYGPGRVPSLATVRARKWQSLNPNGFLNLIHLDDIVAVIAEATERKLFRETILVSDGNPAPRRDYYELLAEKLGLGPIEWTETNSGDEQRRSSSSKKISNNKLKQLTSLKLQHESYQAGIASILSGAP